MDNNNLQAFRAPVGINQETFERPSTSGTPQTQYYDFFSQQAESALVVNQQSTGRVTGKFNLNIGTWMVYIHVFALVCLLFISNDCQSWPFCF